MLEQMIEEIEYLYEPITGIYKQDRAIIHIIKREQASSTYSILKPEHGFPNALFTPIYSTDDASYFLKELNDRHFDMNELESIVTRVILDEITMLDLRREQLAKFVQEYAIQENRESWNELRRKMLASIERLCNNETKE